MTVETDILQAAAALKSIRADLKVLFEQYPDARAREVFGSQMKQAEKMLEKLQNRLEEVRQEEAEYAAVTRAEDVMRSSMKEDDLP